MEGIAAGINGNRVDPAVTDRSGKRRALDRDHTCRAEGVGAVAAELVCPPSRYDPSTEGNKDAFVGIGRIAGKPNGGGEIFRPIRLRVVGGKLCSGENHGFADATLQMHQQRRFFHGIRSVQDDDAVEVAILEAGTDGIADALHVGKGEACRILRHQVDRAKLRFKARYEFQQILTGQDRCACSVFPTLAGDGAASGDHRYGRLCKRHISESSHLPGMLASTARSVASRWMRSRIIYQPRMRAGPMIASEAIVHVPTG